jgi:hypothetical protein
LRSCRVLISCGRPLSFTVRGHLGYAISLGAAALILGAIGLIRAIAEYGVPGAIAFSKLIVVPILVVFWGFLFGPITYGGKFPRNLLPSNEALKVILLILLSLTGAGFALSAAFGVAWLVPK